MRWSNGSSAARLLVLLTLIFFFQNWLTRYPVLADVVRIGFLSFTLFGIAIACAVAM